MSFKRSVGESLGVLLVVIPLAAASASTAAERKPVAEINTSSGLAVKGYDPVAYFTLHRPEPGKPEYSYAWRGVTWRFASAEDRDLFMRSSEQYAPQYGGYCAFAMSRGFIADISPKAWAVVDGKLYLNNNAFAHKLWSLERTRNIDVGDKNWAQFPKTVVAMNETR